MKRIIFPLLLSCLLSGRFALAQDLQAPLLTGTWEGSMMIGPNSFTLAFTLDYQQGNYTATFTSKDMGIYGMPADSVVVDSNRVRIRVLPVDGEYSGRLRMNDEGTAVLRIDGDWFQESELLPVTLLPVEKPTL